VEYSPEKPVSLRKHSKLSAKCGNVIENKWVNSRPGAPEEAERLQAKPVRALYGLDSLKVLTALKPWLPRFDSLFRLYTLPLKSTL